MSLSVTTTLVKYEQSQLEPTQVYPLTRQCLNGNTSIRLGWKLVKVTNTLAYKGINYCSQGYFIVLAGASVTKKNKFHKFDTSPNLK
jgi:hypothetical protein